VSGRETDEDEEEEVLAKPTEGWREADDEVKSSCNSSGFVDSV
jgi:hypothetical protein